MKDDRRPAWLLRKNARISSQRRHHHVGDAETMSPEEWWQQIEAAAAELKLETKWQDWQVWPTDDDGVP